MSPWKGTELGEMRLELETLFARIGLKEPITPFRPGLPAIHPAQAAHPLPVSDVP